MSKSGTYNSRTSRRTWSNKCKLANNPRRTTPNERRHRIGQTHVASHPMPHAFFRHSFLGDGTQVAIARTNDRYICGHFDANEKPLCEAVVFEGGMAQSRALTWLKRQRQVNGLQNDRR